MALTKRSLPRLALPVLLASTSVLAGPQDDAAPCDLGAEIRALRETLRELVDIERQRAEQAEAVETTQLILALDQGIVTLDRELREALREREEVATELTQLRGGYESTAERADSSTEDFTREQSRKALPWLQEKIALKEERLGELESRADELRTTLDQRRQALVRLTIQSGP